MHPVVELVDNKMILGLGIPAATEKDTAAPPASEGLVVIRLVTMTGQTKSFHCAENGKPGHHCCMVWDGIANEWKPVSDGKVS